MTFMDWMETVPQELKGDPLWRMGHVLTDTVATHRMRLLTQIIRLLLTIIPSERGYKLQEESEGYEMDKEVLPADLLTNIPMPL